MKVRRREEMGIKGIIVIEERKFILKKREKSTSKEEVVGTIKEDEDFEKKLKKLHVSLKAVEEFKKLHEKILKNFINENE